MKKFGAFLIALMLVQPAFSAVAKKAVVDDGLLEARQQIISGVGGSYLLRSVADYFPTKIIQAGDKVWQLPGGHTEALDNLVIRADENSMSMAEFLSSNKTNALLVVVGGEIIHETYRNGTNDKTLFLSASIAKSFTSALIGIAVKEGLISSVEDPVIKFLPDLSGTVYEGVTVKNLLQMNSGVLYSEDGVAEGQRDIFSEWLNRVLFANEISLFDLIGSLERDAKPGTKFNYNTIDTMILGHIIERQAGMPLEKYMASKLWNPMGAENDARYLLDGPSGVGFATAGSGINATMRDYARFGQLMLQGGFANGQQIVPADWVQFSTTPDASRPDMARSKNSLGYHYQWWLPDRPGTFLALGLMGQIIYVDSMNDIVIVKTSYYPPGSGDYYPALLGFFNAVSEWAAKR